MAASSSTPTTTATSDDAPTEEQPAQKAKLESVSCGSRTYRVLSTIGAGASASVFRGAYKNDICALKIVPNDHKSGGFLRAELLALEKLSAHPNIISLNYYGLDLSQGVWFLDLELAEGGDALGRIQKGALTEDHCKSVAYRLFQAIAFAHSQGVCHRDIKLENLLFRDRECTIPILADWGMSATFNCYEPLKRDCGSLHYAAPEILSNQPYFGDQVDSFSAGILVFALASACFPFTGKTPRTRLLDIVTRERLPFPRHLSANFRDFCCGLVETDPRNRLTITKALLHPWFSDFHVNAPATDDPPEGIDLDVVVQSPSAKAAKKNRGLNAVKRMFKMKK